MRRRARLQRICIQARRGLRLAHERGNSSGTGGPLSVLLLIRSLEMGGAERQLVELARGMQFRGHRVTVAAFYKRGPLLAELDEARVRVVDLAKRGRWDVAGFLLRTRKAIAKARPDVVYSFLGGANLVATAATATMRSTRLVWSIRASRVDLSKYGWLHKASYRIERLLSNAPDLIIANSNAGREFAASQGFPADKIEVVHNGIDADRFRPDLRLRKEQRGKWKLDEHDIAIGVLARLDPMKGHETFLTAAAEVSRQLAEAKFFCIGEGSELARLRGLADQLGIAARTRFVGRTDDSRSALNGLDIYCSPSYFGEGFSNAIAEAMACGVPCVVTDVGDAALIVGETGLVVPRSDANTLAVGLIEQANGLASYDGLRSRVRIVENFSVDAMVDRTLDVMQRLSRMR
jgi:glycosyltransferase involved in cell wall biosynthesis